MQKVLHLIYIPGLGDTRVSGQQKAINSWRLWGVEAELFQMNWGDQETWESKLKRLLARIDALVADHKLVGLVGASAGASAVINTYALRKDVVVGCVLIAGKVNRPEAIARHYRNENPAFVQSVEECQRALTTFSEDDRKNILSRYALADEIVFKSDSRIPGAHNQIVPSISHILTIAAQITFGAFSFIRFLKRISRGIDR